MLQKWALATLFLIGVPVGFFGTAMSHRKPISRGVRYEGAAISAGGTALRFFIVGRDFPG
jgi:hypothetical protein